MDDGMCYHLLQVLPMNSNEFMVSFICINISVNGFWHRKCIRLATYFQWSWNSVENAVRFITLNFWNNSIDSLQYLVNDINRVIFFHLEPLQKKNQTSASLYFTPSYAHILISLQYMHICIPYIFHVYFPFRDVIVNVLLLF